MTPGVVGSPAAVLRPEAFARDAVYAWGDPSDDLQWRLSIARGRENIARALHGRDEAAVKILRRVDRGGDHFAEGRTVVAGEPATTFLRVQVDASGAVTRALSLWCHAADPPAATDHGPRPDGRPVIEAYFAGLRAARFDDAAACFTGDCFYTHPPWPGGEERIVYRGREAVARGFHEDRGPTPVIQVVTAFVQDGATAFAEGVVEGIPDGGTWAAALTLSPDGLLDRYVAFYGAPRVPGASPAPGPGA